MSIPATKNGLSPMHPGMLLGEILHDLDLSQAAFARIIGVSPMRISHVVRGERPVTADLALRFGRAFGQSPQMWSSWQAEAQGRPRQDQASRCLTGARCARSVPDTFRDGCPAGRVSRGRGRRCRRVRECGGQRLRSRRSFRRATPDSRGSSAARARGRRVQDGARRRSRPPR